MVQHRKAAVAVSSLSSSLIITVCLGALLLTETSQAQALFPGQAPTPLKLKSNPLPACERGLRDPRFIEALDDHFNSVFAGRSMDERIRSSSDPTPTSREEKLQIAFSEVYSSEIRMKTNSLIKKFGKVAEKDSSYAMPFHCLTPLANGMGFNFELSSIPCSDPDNALSSLEDPDSPKTRAILQDLLKTGGKSPGTQVLQSCTIGFTWNKSRKRYFAEKSSIKDVSPSLERDGSDFVRGVNYQISGLPITQSRINCPLSTRPVLGCNIRLHPRSEKHLFRLTQSDWMPAREAVVCELTKDPSKAFDLEVPIVKKLIQDDPSVKDIASDINPLEKIRQSDEQALVRLLRERVQIGSGDTVSALRQAVVDFYSPRPCQHLTEGAFCNVVVLTKKHRYARTFWDTFDYGIMSQDQQTVRGLNGNLAVGPFTENRSYHDLPGLVGRAFLFGDSHPIYNVGGNPSRRQVEMFCSESK